MPHETLAKHLFHCKLLYFFIYIFICICLYILPFRFLFMGDNLLNKAKITESEAGKMYLVIVWLKNAL